MYAREVSLHLKANAGNDFTRTIEKDILPRLRKQTGFADELTFLNPNGTDAVAISLCGRLYPRHLSPGAQRPGDGG